MKLRPALDCPLVAWHLRKAGVPLGNNGRGNRRLVFWPVVGLAVAIMIWGFNFVVVKSALSVFDPMAFFVIRYATASLATLILVRAFGGIRPVAKADLPLIFIAGIVGVTLTQTFFVYSLASGPASVTAVLLGTTPVWTTVIAILVRQDRFRVRHAVAVCLGLAGATLVAEASLGGTTAMPSLLALATAVTFGAFPVTVRPLLRRYTVLQVSLLTTSMGTIVAVPFALPQLLSTRWTSIPPTAWLALLYAALLAVAFTNVLYFWAIHHVGASRAAMILFAEPFLGAWFSLVFLDEQLSPSQIAGGLLVASALVLSYRPSKVPVTNY